MAPAYNYPSIEPIVEDSEDESSNRPRAEIRGTRGFGEPSSSQKHHASERDMNDKMPLARGSVSKTKSRKSHKSTSHSNTVSSKHGTRTKVKTQSYGQASSSGMTHDRETYSPPRGRHRRSKSGRNLNSGESSDSDGEGPIEDHREVLAATRSRLMSPSVVSIRTSLTTATNTSSGSSGSNSTVTQASISKGPNGKRAEEDHSPPSPAVPDPPDVFAYMDPDSIPESFAPFTSPSPIPHDIKQSRHTSTSSASSSFHSDNASEPAADVDTDRSTSPERSVKGEEQRNDNEHDDENTWDPRASHENDGYSSSTNIKYEAQLRAAHERQSLHERRTGPNPSHYHPHLHHQQYQPPNPSASQALTPRPPPPPPPQTILPVPQPERVPPSGYNLLAQNLSSPTRKFPPIYRRFEALNHRILLSLQDEIMELEDELRRLDDWDTNARSFGVSVSDTRKESPQSSSSSVESKNQSHGTLHEKSNSTGNQAGIGSATHIARHIHPSSRRHEAHYPSELSYSKSQLLQTLQYKLAQYNAHLKTFDDAARLSRPADREVEDYRQFLKLGKPLVEAESKYLDEAVEKDLVVIGGATYNKIRESLDTNSIISVSPGFRRTMSSSSSTSEQGSPDNKNENIGVQNGRIPLATLATALAAAFLVPILTFGIIPNWLGRMTVVLLVGLGVWGGVWQSLAVSGRDMTRDWMLGGDVLVVAGVYGGVMAVVAAVVG